MRGREEFGKYLLLKKLSEDPLGETFRAGRVAGGSVDQVVLLRVFNGRNVDGGKLWQRISGRGPVQEALKNPNIGSGVDLGEERGVPYVAYDYVSGRNLENLLIQASNTNTPVPVDHALLVAERMSLGLSAAAETRGPEGRVLHGFAVPHLVMVSNEGETRVLGFEAAPGLAEQAGSLPGEITRYLAPEVVAGQAVDPSDDVYTLGAVLWELLACKPLPKSAGTDPAAAIDGAQVAYDGTPFPAEVAALLKRSLAPRGQRVANAADWHKALTQLMAKAGHTATTFNLAFFMHNLFRDEIEEENRQIEEEKNISVEEPAAAAAAPVAAGAAGAEAPESGETTADRYADEETEGSNKGLLIGLAAVLLIALLGGGWFYMNQQKAAEEEAAAAAAAAEQAEEEEPEEPAGPSPEEIQAQISAMLDARSEEMEEKLGSQYDEQLRALQGQLAEAEAAAAAAEKERQRKLEEERQRAEAEAERLAAEEAARIASEEEAARKAEEERKAKEAERLAAQQQAEEEQQQVEAAPPKPQTKEGDLVGMGDGVTPPQLISPPQVRYPAMARKLAKEADVEVRVLVDERGNVRDVEPLGKKAGFGFDAAAEAAARSAKYRPAMKDGVRVKMYVNLTIRFNL